MSIKSPNHQITKSPNHQITKSPNHQITKSPNHQITKSPNHQITKSPNHQITKSPNHQITKSPNHQITKSLDLGCGSKPKNPFNANEVMGIDIREDLENHIYRADLIKEGIPFPDESFDFVTAFDFIEHVPRIIYTPEQQYPFIAIMNEIWRVLKPGGKFLSHTPAYPHPEAFQDPTHVNIITKDTFRLYFDHQRIWARMYGFRGAFIIKSQRWRGPHLISILEKTTSPEKCVERSRYWFQRMWRGY